LATVGMTSWGRWPIVNDPAGHCREGHRRGLVRYLATGEGPMIRSASRRPRSVRRKRVPGRTHHHTNLVGRAALLTGYLRDITERKRSELELRRSEAFLARANVSVNWAASPGVWTPM